MVNAASISTLPEALQSYYTQSPEIVTYMVALLAPNPGEDVWEPCAGRGDLIEGVLRAEPLVHIHANEIDPEAIQYLKNKYGSRKNVTLSAEDTPVSCASTLFGQQRLLFDKIIANPPYGGWQDISRRRFLKSQYPSLYVKETYGVFMHCCFSRLKLGGRMVFIVPDTFLWLNRHEHLRRNLFSHGTVREITLFPSDFFPGVSFGYSGMCIISIQRTENPSEAKFRVNTGLKTVAALASLANREGCASLYSERLYSQREVLASPQCSFSTKRLPGVLGQAECTLGEIAEVVTGFYSGNDRKWIRRATNSARKASHLSPVASDLIFTGEPPPPIGGVENAACFIPIVRGGSGPFHKPTQFYVDWSIQAVNEYRRKGSNPARFQNSRFYFHEGIAVPMVASSRLTAAPLQRRLFDQSIVGVFPRNERLFNFVLGFLNTKLATDLLRRVNPTANNSANYLKRLPFTIPGDEALESANRLVDNLVEQARSNFCIDARLVKELETMYTETWGQQSL